MKLMKSTETITRILVILALAFSVGVATGCKEEGAAEKAGKAIDNAVDDAEDEAERLKKKLE